MGRGAGLFGGLADISRRKPAAHDRRRLPPLEAAHASLAEGGRRSVRHGDLDDEDVSRARARAASGVPDRLPRYAARPGRVSGALSAAPRRAAARAGVTRRQAYASVLCAMPFSASSVSSSPDWNISVMMSQPPTNSPFT